MHDQAESITQKLAVFIKEKREALGMSQYQFAVYVFNDVKKQSWICRIENGRGITLKTIERIFEALNCGITINEF